MARGVPEGYYIKNTFINDATEDPPPLPMPRRAKTVPASSRSQARAATTWEAWGGLVASGGTVEEESEEDEPPASPTPEPPLLWHLSAQLPMSQQPMIVLLGTAAQIPQQGAGSPSNVARVSGTENEAAAAEEAGEAKVPTTHVSGLDWHLCTANMQEVAKACIPTERQKPIGGLEEMHGTLGPPCLGSAALEVREREASRSRAEGKASCSHVAEKDVAVAEVVTFNVSGLGGHLCIVKVPAANVCAFYVKCAIENATGIPTDKQKLFCGLEELQGPLSPLLLHSASAALEVTLVKVEAPCKACSFETRSPRDADRLQHICKVRRSRN